MNPKNRYFLNALVVALLWFLIFCFANMIFANKIITRIDFTKSKKFSLSPYSKGVISRVNHPLKVIFYLSKKVPSSMDKLRRYSQNFLKEYQIYGHQKVDLQFVDPTELDMDDTKKGNSEEDGEYGRGITDSLIKYMAKKGIPLSFTKEKGKNFYFFSSMRIEYQKKKRILEHIQNRNNLEYRLTSAIDKLISLSAAKIGLYGTGDITFDVKRSKFGELLYRLRKLNRTQVLRLNSEKLFTLAEEFSKDLQGGKITERLRERFRKQDHPLSPKAVLEGKADKWLIRDGKKIYLLKKEKKSLTVFNPHHPIPEDVKILMVFARARVPQEALYEIDQFIQRGGKVIFFSRIFDQSRQILDVSMDHYFKMPKQYRRQMIGRLLQQRQARLYLEKVETNLDGLLSHYGIYVEPVLLTDYGSCLKIVQQSYSMGFFRDVKKKEERYIPEGIRILPENCNREYSFVNSLENMVFIFANSFKSSLPKDKKDAKFIPLMSTTDQVTALEYQKKEIRKENFDLSGTGKKSVAYVMDVKKIQSISRKKPTYKKHNPKRHISAMVQGKFTPYFSSPPWAFSGKAKGQKRPAKKCNILVVGNMFFLTNMFQDVLKFRFRMKKLSAFRFIRELIEWLDSGENLSSIRAKHLQSRPLKKLTKGEKFIWKMVMTTAMPFLVLLFGLIMLAMRGFGRPGPADWTTPDLKRGIEDQKKEDCKDDKQDKNKDKNKDKE